MNNPVQEKLIDLQNRAKSFYTSGDFENSNKVYEEIFTLSKSVSDDLERAGLLFENALKISEYINKLDIPELFWNEAENIYDKLNDMPSKSLLIHNTGTIYAQHKNYEKACENWEKSIKIKEEVGDTLGISASLLNLAWIAKENSDNQKQKEINLKAARLLSENRVWNELIKVLIELADLYPRKRISYLSQALILCIYSDISADIVIFIVSEILKIIGLDNEFSPVIATTGLILSDLYSKDDQQRDELQKDSLEILGACAVAQNISNDEVINWIFSEGLNNPDILFPRLEDFIVSFIEGNEWFFDRSLLKNI